MLSYRTLVSCRICGGSFSDESLDLLPTGLANELYMDKQRAINAERFPLEVVLCQDCKHFQLRHIVDSGRLFSEYIYRSGTSSFLQAHFDILAEKLMEMFEGRPFKVFEVGSNDGLLLSSLKKRGIKAVGIEPSKILVEECSQRGLDVVHGFLNSENVESAKSRWGYFDVVVGNNVFAHIDNLHDAFLNVYDLLSKGIFDSIYHEHMSFHTLTGLQDLARRTNFTISNFDYVESHGGSFRFILQKGNSHSYSQTVENRLLQESKEGLDSAKVLAEIRAAITEKKLKVIKFLEEISGSEIFIGYGAPAKAVTFISEMGLENIGIRGIIDDNMWKQGKYLPVSGIQIVSKQEALATINHSNRQPIVNFLVFPWNLGPDLLVKLREWAPKGSKSICFFPDLEAKEL
jgi:hypothetical protein